MAKDKKSRREQSRSQDSRTTSRRRRSRKPLPQYHVVLYDDNEHTHEYVVEMLKALFGYAEQVGMELARKVDTEGRAIVYTTHRELAELKRDQVRAYGADPRVERCSGSMSAAIVPAEQ